MKTYTLDLVSSSTKLKDVTEIKRKFLNIRVGSFNCIVQDILKLHNLYSLELTESVIDKRMLVQSLEFLNRLESITADRVEFDVATRDLDLSPVPLKLKHLGHRFSDILILNVISTESLKSFSCHTNSTEVNDVLKLLGRQTLLENLCLVGSIAELMISDPEILKFPFKLRKLEIGRANMTATNVAQAFLTLHKDTLKELTIECAINKQFLGFIMKNMKNLITLKAPLNDNKVEKELIMENIKQFTAVSLKNICSAKALMECFPSLQVLDAKSVAVSPWFMKFITHISHKCIHIQKLHVPYVFAETLESPTFPHLKELHVGQIHDENYFNHFVGRHESLEKISIGWIDGSEFSRNNTVAILNLCPKLNYISITTDSPMVTRMFTKFRRNHNFPWTLESRFRKNRSHETEWIKVIFKFPDDFSLFQDKCSVWDDELIREFKVVENYGLNAYINKFK